MIPAIWPTCLDFHRFDECTVHNRVQQKFCSRFIEVLTVASGLNSE